MTPTINKAFEAQLEAAGLGSLVEQARAQQEKAAEDKRRAAGERLATAEREWSEGERKIDAELTKARAEADAIAERLATARARIGELEDARLALGGRSRGTINNATAELRANPPAAIGEAREKLEALREELVKEPVKADHDTDPRTGAVRITATNQHAIGRRQTAVASAVWALHELTCTYTPAEQLPAKIAAIVATIPNGFDMPTPVERIPPKPAKRAA